MSDPISALILAAQAAYAAYQASVVVRAIVWVAFMVATTLIGKAIAKGIRPANQGQELALKLDPTYSREVALGPTATGGSLAWGFTATDQFAAHPTVNGFLCRVVVLSDRPSNLVKITEGTETITFQGSPTLPTTEGFCLADQHRDKFHDPNMRIWFVPGSDDPDSDPSSLGARATLELLSATNSQGVVWDAANQKGTGLCWAILLYAYDDLGDAFATGEPQLVFHLEGAALTDDRGPTVAPTSNLAIIAASVLRGIYTNDVMLLGANASDDDLPIDRVIEAANICDEPITLLVPDELGNTTEPRYWGGMMFSAAQDVASQIRDLQTGMDGKILDCGGKIVILPGLARTPILDLTDEDVIWVEEQSWQPYVEINGLYNSVAGNYVPKSNNYTAKTFIPQSNPTYVTDDGGQRVVLNRDYNVIHGDEIIQRIVQRVLKASRLQGVYAFVGPLWLWELEQGDWFTMTSARWGYEEKTFEVAHVTFAKDLKVLVVGIETDANIDTWDPNDAVIDDGDTAERWNSVELNVSQMYTGTSGAMFFHQAYKPPGSIVDVVSTNDYYVNDDGDTISLPAAHFNPSSWEVSGTFLWIGAPGITLNPTFWPMEGFWDFKLPLTWVTDSALYLELDLTVVGAGKAEAWEFLKTSVKATGIRIGADAASSAIGVTSTYFNGLWDYYGGVDVDFVFEPDDVAILHSDSGSRTYRCKIDPTRKTRFNWDPYVYETAPELAPGDTLSLFHQVTNKLALSTTIPNEWARGVALDQFCIGDQPHNVSLTDALAYRSGERLVGPTYCTTDTTEDQRIAQDEDGNWGVRVKASGQQIGVKEAIGYDSTVHFYKPLGPFWPVTTPLRFKIRCKLEGTAILASGFAFTHNKVKVHAKNVDTGATYVGVVATGYDDLIDDYEWHEILFDIPYAPTTGAGNLAAGDWLAFIIEIPTQVTQGFGTVTPFIYSCHVATMGPPS